MGKTAKSSKKFVQKHLKSAIAQRRKLKPMKKAMKRKLAQPGANKSNSQTLPTGSDGKANTEVKDMNVDEFLDGGFVDDGEGSSFEDEEDSDINEELGVKDGEDDFIDITPPEFEDDASEEEDDEEEGSGLRSQNKLLRSEVEKHKQQLERLKEKDPEFFQFLKEHDKELLEFDDEDEEDAGDAEPTVASENEDAEPKSSSGLTTSLVEMWCKVIKEKNHMGTVINLLRVYRTACHYGDGDDDEFENKYSISSSHVFNKVMYFTLSEMDTVFRKLLGMDVKEGKNTKDYSTTFAPENYTRWKKVEPLVKSYFGNTLHILNQMTDSQMISFTLQRLKASTSFLVALPKFARKYLKVALQFWGREEGSASFIAFLFIREMALHMGTDHLDACLKGIYKEYAANSKFVNVSSLPRIRFLANCVVELYGIDVAASYQHAFVFIRQLAIILRNALTMKTKESFKNVYSWQYINCLELWVQVLSSYAATKDLQPLVYPITQIISGVAHLLPTARYFPLRFQCVRMLNKLASATGVFIPVAALLLDMLEFKELAKVPTGGVGKSLDFGCVLKVSKPTLKTRAFQDECVAAVVDQFSEHLTQWSYAVAFPELALVPLMGLRRFLKQTRVDRFRRQIKQLVDHIEMNIDYVGKKRDGVSFSPKDAQLVASFLQEEKQAGSSPLSKFSVSLRQKAAQRRTSLHTSSIKVESSQGKSIKDTFNEEDTQDEVANAFHSDWLPPKRPKKGASESKSRLGVKEVHIEENTDSEAEDIVEELELSSDDDDNIDSLASSDEEQVQKPKGKKHRTSNDLNDKGLKKKQKRKANEVRNGNLSESRKQGKRAARTKKNDFK